MLTRQLPQPQYLTSRLTQDLGVQAPRTNFAGTIVPAAAPANGAHSSTNQPDPTTPDPAGAVTGRLTQAGPTEVGEGTPEYDDERGSAGNAQAGPSGRRRGRGRLDDVGGLMSMEGARGI